MKDMVIFFVARKSGHDPIYLTNQEKVKELLNDGWSIYSEQFITRFNGSKYDIIRRW